MEEILEEVDLDQFVNQPVPEDPEKLRLSLIFSKDLITTLQQDIADLHHRLHVADSEYDGTNDIDDEEDDLRAGIHITNATLTKMDGSNANANETETDLENMYNTVKPSINNEMNLYEMAEEDNDEDEDQHSRADEVLNKKTSDHEKFFSTYNILSKQVNTGQTLVESMGTYEALLYLSDNAITFTKIVSGLQMQLKTAKDSFTMVQEALEGISSESDYGNEQDLEKRLFVSNAKEILTESNKIVSTIDSSIDELNGAKELIHPDQKKIFALQSRIKELQVALPLHKIKKLAILNELPIFIKQELSDAKIQKQAGQARDLQRLREQRKGHLKKRTKTLVDDDIPAEDVGMGLDMNDMEEKEREEKEEEAEEQRNENRIESFDTTMEGVSTCLETLSSRIENITDTIEGMEADLETMDDPASTLLVSSIDDIRDQMQSCLSNAQNIGMYFGQAKQYVHPTQNVLITAVNRFVEEKINNDRLQKQIEILKGELNAKNEEIESLRSVTQHSNVSNNDSTQQFVSRIAQQLREMRDKSLSIHTLLKQEQDYETELKDLKNKTSMSYDEIKAMDSDLTDLRDIFDELSTTLMSDENSLLNLTPQNEYILQLEARYNNLKKLYRLKFTELESAKDSVFYNESLIETRNEEILELENRLVRIMTSASTSAQTRMEAINTMGHKSQTYRSVMDLIDDNLRLSGSALNEIEKITRFNRLESNLSKQDSKDVENYCQTIKKGLEAVQTDMSGVRNFVHPDRDMVYALQEQIFNNQTVIEQQSSDHSSKVHFNNAIADNDTHTNSKKSDPRRTKSVHEIAWSKFNAGHESNMEDLEKVEKKVLEEEIRNQILGEVQQEYDDKFDQSVAQIRAQLTQDIREQIRVEYEDLEAHIASQQSQPYATEQIDMEQIKMDLEDQYDQRLEIERKKIDEYYANKEKAIQSELNDKNEKNNQLQTECATMHSEIQNLTQKQDAYLTQIKDISDSKLKLIKCTSAEIDALRGKIKQYTEEIGDQIKKITHDRVEN